MFVFADETGHSGRHIFNEPKEFKLAALLSVEDPEPVLEGVISSIKQSSQVEKLHANEQTLDANVQNANAILDAIEGALRWEFNLSVIDKPYISTTKFVDLIFDSGENSATPPHWYQIELFRHVICIGCEHILTEKNRKKFWWAFLNGDESVIKESVRNARTYALRIPDPKLRAVMIDSFDFFLRKTDQFTIGSRKLKRDYQGHTPNVVAFSILMRAVNLFAETHNSPPVAFVHDRQDEFSKTMKEWHQLWGGVIMDDDKNGWWPKVRMAVHDLPALTIGISAESPALQAVDTLLWIERRSDNHQGLKECQKRLQKNSNPHFIAPWMSQLIVDMRLKQAHSNELDFDSLTRAQLALDDIELKRIERIRATYN